MAGTNLMEADLTGANLHKARLLSVELRDHNGGATGRMWPTNLSRAALLDACLSEADLTEANLTGADLRGADLSGANMARTIINGANMEGAKFKGVISFNGVIEDVAKQTIPKGVAKQKRRANLATSALGNVPDFHKTFRKLNSSWRKTAPYEVCR